MALLSVEKRKEYFKYLGLGAYSKKNILKMQKKYMLRKSDWDGCYGPDTDALLRHLRNVKKHAPSFRPEEFRCGCNGRYCSGYPTRMKVRELKHLQTIRDHYKRPMEITSGLRCKKYNDELRGSSTQSYHMHGFAADFYMEGVTDTLAHRKKAIRYIRKLKNHHYTYGDGVYTWGNSGAIKSIAAPNMGNALHTDVVKD